MMTEENYLMSGAANIGSGGEEENVDRAKRFAKAYFETAWEIARERNPKLTKKEFAEKIFGYEKAFNKIQGGAMRLTFEQAFRMAEYIGWRFSRLIDLVRIKLEEEEDPM